MDYVALKEMLRPRLGMRFDISTQDLAGEMVDIVKEWLDCEAIECDDMCCSEEIEELKDELAKTQAERDTWYNGYMKLLEEKIAQRRDTNKKHQYYSFYHKLDRIFDELRGMKETTGLSAQDDEDRMQLLNMIDDIIGR
jgi:hypothetical protein